MKSPSEVGLLYLAAPYSQGDPVENTHVAVKAWGRLTDAGYTVLVPHSSLMLHLIEPRPVQFWYEYDIKLLAKCDGLVRIGGYSPGADNECKYAIANEIPIYNINDLLPKRGNLDNDEVRRVPRHSGAGMPIRCQASEWVIGRL